MGWKVPVLFNKMAGAAATYADKVLGYSPIAYWPMNETSGTAAVCQVNTAQNGTYARDVSVMGTGDGIGDGNTAPLFDGTNDYVNIQTATLAGAFNGDLGWYAGWLKMTAGVWTDSTTRGVLTLEVDANNDIKIRRESTDNNVRFNREANNANETTLYGTGGPYTWCHFGMTWNQVGDDIQYYWAGSAVDDDQGLQAFVGVLAVSVIGAVDAGGTNPFSGYLAHIAIGAGGILTPTQMLDLATV